MSKNLPRLEYVMKKIEINKHTLNAFATDDVQRRLIRGSRVNGIAASLRAGKHFGSSFVTNLKNGKNYLLDGNHRFEAIKKVMAADPAFKIEVWYAEHKDLTADEEREVFRLWNIGMKQSADDFLKIYWKTIPYGEDILKKCSADIYGTKTKIKIKTIVGAHDHAMNSKYFSGSLKGGTRQFMDVVKEVGPADIVMMRAFLLDMAEIFGPYNKSEEYWKPNAVMTFYKIWYDNKTIPRTTLIKAFQKLFLNPATSRQWRDQARIPSRDSARLFYSLVTAQLNALKGIGGVRFVVVPLAATRIDDEELE